MRGTAFVVFKDLQGSTAALRGLDGEGFFGKQLVSRYVEARSTEEKYRNPSIRFLDLCGRAGQMEGCTRNRGDEEWGQSSQE